MEKNIRIINFDFDNPVHQDSLLYLMNEYINDEMGGGDPIPEYRKPELVKGLKNVPTALVLLAQYDGKYVGLANCFINFGTFALKKFINVHDIVVLKKYRGLGVGKKLLETIVEISEKLDCSKVTLEVREDNKKAKQLYQKVGFGQLGPAKMEYWTKVV